MTRAAKSSRSISAFFPCYNEQENVRETHRAISDVLSGLTDDYEILFVDDGSTDATSEILNSIAELDSRVRIVSHQKNLGYGSALKSGFATATKDLIFYSDCDGQFDLGELLDTIHLAEKYDIVSCFRKNRSEGLLRALNAGLWRMLILVIFQKNIRDVDCAFKIYRKEVFDNLNLLSTGALIDAEVLVRSMNRGFAMVQVGVSHYPRMAGASTGANPRVIVRALSEIYKFHNDIRYDKR